MARLESVFAESNGIEVSREAICEVLSRVVYRCLRILELRLEGEELETEELVRVLRVVLPYGVGLRGELGSSSSRVIDIRQVVGLE